MCFSAHLPLCSEHALNSGAFSISPHDLLIICTLLASYYVHSLGSYDDWDGDEVGKCFGFSLHILLEHVIYTKHFAK